TTRSRPCSSDDAERVGAPADRLEAEPREPGLLPGARVGETDHQVVAGRRRVQRARERCVAVAALAVAVECGELVPLRGPSVRVEAADRRRDLAVEGGDDAYRARLSEQHVLVEQLAHGLGVADLRVLAEVARARVAGRLVAELGDLEAGG